MHQARTVRVRVRSQSSGSGSISEFGFGFDLRVRVRVRSQSSGSGSISEFGFGFDLRARVRVRSQSSGSGITEWVRLHRVFRQLFKHFLKYIDDHRRTLGSVRFGFESGFFRTWLILSVWLTSTRFYCLTENYYIQDRTRTWTRTWTRTLRQTRTFGFGACLISTKLDVVLF
jgi:hypothetical protein